MGADDECRTAGEARSGSSNCYVRLRARRVVQELTLDVHTGTYINNVGVGEFADGHFVRRRDVKAGERRRCGKVLRTQEQCRSTLVGGGDEIPTEAVLLLISENQLEGVGVAQI